MPRGGTAALVFALLASAPPPPLLGQIPVDLASASGAELYRGACANCHGVDGQGVEAALLAFEEEVPDFTDCDFAAREPDADWIAVAHEGGPVRGFSEMMPAFRGALTEDQLGRVMGYIRTLCTDPAWPRGELNLPRALLTEKAYPEDEWVVEAGARLQGEGDLEGAFVYEKRFGPRSQWEVVVPYRWRKHDGDGGGGHEIDEGGGEGSGGGQGGAGFGDVVLGVKHAAFHSAESGSILSFGGEVILPTGDDSKGLGAPGAAVEVFVSFGQIIAGDAFLQAQGGVGVPLYDGADSDTFGRLVLGRSFSQGRWGRGWTPMVEFVAARALGSGEATRVDVVPQLQVALNTRQHVLGNVGVLVPATRTTERPIMLVAYVLLDWFDGGFFEGW